MRASNGAPRGKDRVNGVFVESKLKPNNGLTAFEALIKHRKDLSEYEQKEILRYDKVYFVGAVARKHDIIEPDSEAAVAKTKRSTLSTSVEGQNIPKLPSFTGDLVPKFDDQEHFYNIIKHDHIGYRFEVLSLLGKGSFGQVVCVYDHYADTYMALKIIRTEARFTRQAREEIKILEKLRDLRSMYSHRADGTDFPIVQLHEHFTFRKHICMTFELLGINLYDLLKLKKFAGLPRDRVRRISFQILKALYYVGKAGIIHCDLKPENVLLLWTPEKQKRLTTETVESRSNGFRQSPRSDETGPISDDRDYVKLIDFGSSTFDKGPFYPYIQSRFYRAPEVILRLGYTQAIDMWSFGCLLAELINGLPLFPGEDEGDQLTCIMEILGIPPNEMLQKSPQFDRYFIEYRRPANRPIEMASYFDQISTASAEPEVTYLPKYCTFRYPDENDQTPPELQPGITKRSGQMRGVPASKALLPTILQPRVRRSRLKDGYSFSDLTSHNDLNGQGDDGLTLVKDNELLLTFLLECLALSPSDRIQPSKAMKSPWLRNLTRRVTVSSKTTERVCSMEVSQIAPPNKSIEIRNQHQVITAHEIRTTNGQFPHSRVNKRSTLNDNGAPILPDFVTRMNNTEVDVNKQEHNQKLHTKCDRYPLGKLNGTINENRIMDGDDTTHMELKKGTHSLCIPGQRELSVQSIIQQYNQAHEKQNNAKAINRRVTLIYLDDYNNNGLKAEGKVVSVSKSIDSLSIRDERSHKNRTNSHRQIDNLPPPTHHLQSSSDVRLPNSQTEFREALVAHHNENSSNTKLNEDAPKSSRIVSNVNFSSRPYSEFYTKLKNESEMKNYHNKVADLSKTFSDSVPHLSMKHAEKTELQSNTTSHPLIRNGPILVAEEDIFPSSIENRHSISNYYTTHPNENPNTSVLITKEFDPPNNAYHSKSTHALKPCHGNFDKFGDQRFDSKQVRTIHISNLKLSDVYNHNDIHMNDRIGEHSSEPTESSRDIYHIGSNYPPRRGRDKESTKVKRYSPNIVGQQPTSGHNTIESLPNEIKPSTDFYLISARPNATSNVWAPQPYSHNNVLYHRINAAPNTHHRFLTNLPYNHPS